MIREKLTSLARTRHKIYDTSWEARLDDELSKSERAERRLLGRLEDEL
jgi:hypothetical protein